MKTQCKQMVQKTDGSSQQQNNLAKSCSWQQPGVAGRFRNLFLYTPLGTWLEKPTECKTLRHWYGLLVQKVDRLILNCYNKEEILYKIPVSSNHKAQDAFFVFNQSHLERLPLPLCNHTYMHKIKLIWIALSLITKDSCESPQSEFFGVECYFSTFILISLC